MPTAKQIAANRRNAQKSTGPRTETGKAKIKLNALKHGLTAETVVLPFESAADYDELRQSVLEDLKPRGVTHQILVERFVQRHWVAQRLARTERAWIQVLYQAHLIEGLKGAKNPKKILDPYTGLAISMLEIRPDDPQDFLHKNFFRYRAQIEQDFQRALRALERNHLLASPSEDEEILEIGSVSEASHTHTASSHSHTAPPPDAAPECNSSAPQSPLHTASPSDPAPPPSVPLRTPSPTAPTAIRDPHTGASASRRTVW